jgi:hypothetical protein
MDETRDKTSKEAGERIAKNWDKPLALPRAVPKPSSLKKKGRPSKETTE